MKAISLFSCGGIGDLALKYQGVDVLLANELSYERAQVFLYNFPKIKILIGDIWQKKEEIICETNSLLKGEQLDLVFATLHVRVCQRMDEGSCSIWYARAKDLKLMSETYS